MKIIENGEKTENNNEDILSLLQSIYYLSRKTGIDLYSDPFKESLRKVFSKAEPLFRLLEYLEKPVVQKEVGTKKIMLFEKIPNECLFKNELDKIVSFYNERLVPAHEKVAFVESNKREGFTCRDLFSVIYPLLQKIKIVVKEKENQQDSDTDRYSLYISQTIFQSILTMKEMVDNFKMKALCEGWEKLFVKVFKNGGYLVLSVKQEVGKYSLDINFTDEKGISSFNKNNQPKVIIGHSNQIGKVQGTHHTIAEAIKKDLFKDKRDTNILICLNSTTTLITSIKEYCLYPTKDSEVGKYVKNLSKKFKGLMPKTDKVTEPFFKSFTAFIQSQPELMISVLCNIVQVEVPGNDTLSRKFSSDVKKLILGLGLGIGPLRDLIAFIPTYTQSQTINLKEMFEVKGPALESSPFK